MIDEEELRREREANITGVPEKNQEWIPAPRCEGCLDKSYAVCLFCLNWGICSNKSNKPRCWVAKRCEKCERRL